jgi:uncharacterized protein (TIGR02246 family)
MRTRRLFLPVLLTCLAFAGTASAGDLSKDDLAALEAATQAFAKATNAKDWKAVAAMYTEDAVLMPSNMPMVKGRAAIQAFFENYLPMTDFTLEHVAVKGSGDVASIAGRWSLKMVTEEESIPDSGYFLDTRLRQKDGSWLISLDMFYSENPVQE